MKNKFIKIILIIVLSLSSFSIILADEFIFEVSELEVTDNGNIYKGINKGKITTATKTEITSDNFRYLKKINELYAYGDAQILDFQNELKINAEEIFYLKNEEIIYTIGKTLIKISDKYNIEGSDIKLLRNKMILSSLKKAIIRDNEGTVYKLDEFEYSVNQEMLKGEKIQVTTNNEKPESDTYFFESGFFDFKKDKFLAKDTELIFHKSLFDNDENDPRLKSVTSYGDEFNTFFKKGIFTSCNKNDKCPPWKIKSNTIHHDKIKKQIKYTNAWLNIYDVPIVYFPKFFHPDPTVKRQSGFLRPAYIRAKTLGNSTYVPYFWIISEDKDLTIKPRYFRNNKFILQNEYRQVTKKSLTIADFSFAKGHDSSSLDIGDSRSHFFVNSKYDLGLKEFKESMIEFNFEKASNDSYLKVFDLKSPLLVNKEHSVLESGLSLDITHEDYNFSGFFKMFETMNGLTDRYQYVLPSYSFGKNFKLDKINGGFSFGHSGNNTYNADDSIDTSISNNLTYTSFNKYFQNGIKRNHIALFKNLNSLGKKSTSLKSSPQSEIMSAYVFNTSFPLLKDEEKSISTLEPKISFRFSPHDMKNNKNQTRAISMDNIYSQNRLNLTNSYEGGESVTLGIDYNQQKVNIVKETSLHLDEIKEIDDYLAIRLATVFRPNEEDGIPITSTLNKKTSHIFGQIEYEPTKIFTLDYNFSLKNDLEAMEYNSISTLFEFNNFSTRFDFTEQRGVLGNANVIGNETEYNFNDENSLTFKTRKNRDLNLTEFYDLVYEYKNDCLIASVEYKKKYYEDNNVVPLEELLFSITIVPLTTYSPNKMVLNKNRKD